MLLLLFVYDIFFVFITPLFTKVSKVILWVSAQENLSSVFANNNSANQPVHSHRLISAFVICLFECMISKLAPSKS